MKLRTRLFLWVGALFFVAFGLSLFFENYTTDANLKEAETNLRNQIFALGEQKRESAELYLHNSLVKEQALIDSLLVRFARDPELGANLFLNPDDLEIQASVHSAYLFRNKNWINFIQSTKNGKLTSLLIPIDFPMTTTHFIPIEEGFGWVVMHSDRKFDRPFIGVRFHNPKVDQSTLTMSIDHIIQLDWGLTVLFSPESLSLLDLDKPLPSTFRHEDFPDFFDSLKKATQYVKEKQGEKGWIQREIKEKTKGKNPFASEAFDIGIRCLKEEGEALNNRIVQLLQQSDQAIMLSRLTSLFPTGFFGDRYFSKKAPKGIARFPKGFHAGHTVFLEEVMFTERIFDDQSYIQEHSSLKECEGVGSSLAVISMPEKNEVFVGNSLQLKGYDSEGVLTVGISVDELVQNLVYASGQMALLVHGDQVVSAFDQKGEPLFDKAKVPFKKEMVSHKKGIIEWNGKSYYYLQMVPFSSVDLHFFILEPEKSAFALVRSIEEGSREVIEKVSLSMRLSAIVGLVFVLLILHRIARKITKPIAQLAGVTQDVAEGKLDQVEIPKAPHGRSDEVATLIDSFEKMVSGLKEKEKVKGVLNKVVSPEIAQEITKGTIHLGGEERKVTVLFGDIRNFTRMSSHLPPQEVVELLNTCMTKVSHEIDEQGGVIDKYVGDEVMALFGAPIEKEDSALSAIRAALSMVNVLNEWNEERKNKGLAPVEMGFGIHTGLVLVGNMGAENRLNYTVIGSDVNLASRLCSAAAPMEILISQETLNEPHVQESILVEEYPNVQIKGFDSAFTLYRVKGAK